MSKQHEQDTALLSFSPAAADTNGPKIYDQNPRANVGLQVTPLRQIHSGTERNVLIRIQDFHLQHLHQL